MIPLVIFGSEGISREVLTIIEDINEIKKSYEFLGFIEDKKEKIGKNKLGYEIISSDENFEEFSKKFNRLAVVIPQGNPNIKEKIYNKIKNFENLYFPNIIHPNIKIRDTIKLGKGNIITDGVKMTTEIEIGDFNLFNLNSTVGHDVKIQNFNVINPLVSISGGVELGNRNLIGTGSNILQYLKLKDDVIIGSNACLTKSANKSGVYVGTPAKRKG
jgi:sugar O-acyltransferase (sialic acid O-acetyltransferase NeuD family)